MRNISVAIFLVSLMVISSINIILNDLEISLLEKENLSTSSSLNCTNQTSNNLTEIYVDNILGNDSNIGTYDCPLASVTKAVELSSDGVSIILHEGVYHEEIRISGFKNLTLKSAQGERVVFDGTRSVVNDLGGNWTLANDGIHEVDLGIDAWQVFIDYTEQVPARWPNANFSDFSVLNQSHNWAHGSIGNGGTYSNGELQDSGGTDGANNGLANSGIDPIGAIAVLNVASFRTYSRIVTDYDSANDTFFYDTVPNWKNKHHHYFLEGKRELIDVESEWWINSSSDRLHMLFSNGTNPNDMDVRVKTQAYAFNITESDNVSLQGLEFFATTFRSYQCDGCSVIDSDLMYPSTSKRGLGVAGEDVNDRWVSRMDRCSNCLIENSSFAHTDGSAIEFHGAALQSHNNTINNNNFEFIDWSSSDLPGLMVTVYDGGKDNTFSNNTIHRTGASATISIGDAPQLFHNKISKTGFVQSDGAVMQMMQAEQNGAEVAYNWIYNTAKYGIRMDGPAGGTNTGNNATVHHNVLWDIKTGIMVKGNYHYIHNNTVFGNDSSLNKNQIIVLFENGAGNENSTTSNNAADTISAHRSQSYSTNPVPGTYLSNYNGYEESNVVVESMLVDPDNFDFRPLINSELDNLSAGAYDATDPNPWVAGASRMWIAMPPPILGCINSNASNFNINADINDHSCTFEADEDIVDDVDEDIVDDVDEDIVDDVDEDIADEIGELFGCTESDANNYDPLATDDDGTCEFEQLVECNNQVCWDGTEPNLVDCSCPIEDDDSEKKSNSEVIEQKRDYVWIIFISSLLIIIFIMLKKKNSSN